MSGSDTSRPAAAAAPPKCDRTQQHAREMRDERRRSGEERKEEEEEQHQSGVLVWSRTNRSQQRGTEHEQLALLVKCRSQHPTLAPSVKLLPVDSLFFSVKSSWNSFFLFPSSSSFSSSSFLNHFHLSPLLLLHGILLSFVVGDILCHSLPFFSSCVPGPSRRPQIGRRAAAAVNPPPQILVGHSTLG